MNPIPAALPGQCDKDWSSYVKFGKAGIRMNFVTVFRGARMRRAAMQILSARVGDLSTQLLSLLETKAERWRIGSWCGRASTSIDWIESVNNYVQLYCGATRHLLGEILTGLAERRATST